jgi:uncharacterized protein
VRANPYLIVNGDTPLSARVHRATDDPLERQPAVLVTGSWLTVKEQMADHYARALAARGYTVFTFDFAGWFHDTASVAPFYGGLPGVRARQARGHAALEAYLRDGTVRTVPAYEAGNEAAGMFFELDYYENPTRGAVPAWRNEMAELSWVYWLGFDGLSAAPAVSVPTLLVHGDDCVLPDNARSVHDRLAGPKSLVWMDGAQTDFYDRPAQVSKVVDAVDDHFRTTTRTGQGRSA